jgi:hypothetical protein
MPIKSSCLPTENPGEFFSTMKAVMPLCPADLSVAAMTMKIPASSAQVMNRLVPLST